MPRRSPAVVVASCALLAVLAGGACTVGTAGADQETLGQPSAAAIRTDVARYLQDVDHTAKVRAVLVEVDGETVLEHYVDADADDFFDSRSVTKSVVAAAVGIAIDEGHIDGVDQTLAELLPDHAGQMSPAVAAVTLEQVLTHTGGFALDDGPDSEYWLNPDPVAAVLDAGVGAKKDERFTYSSSGSHLLSAVLAEATGETVLDYVGDRLLDPLGVSWEPAFDPVVGHDLNDAEYERFEAAYLASDFGWWRDPAGLHDGGSGMRLRPVDLLALGRLYLNGGRVGEEQVVPATWVEISTQVQVQDTGMLLPRYGYNWWLTDADGHEAFVAFGRGGQMVEVVPDLDLVVAVATEIDDGDQTGETMLDPTEATYMVELAVLPHLPPR